MKKSLIYELRDPGRIVIRKGGALFFLDPDEVNWIEANGQYTVFHCSPDSYSIRESIGTVESVLDPNRFVRIHRSLIVNVSRIRQIRSWLRGEYKIIMGDGAELQCSAMHKERLLTRLSNGSFTGLIQTTEF